MTEKPRTPGPTENVPARLSPRLLVLTPVGSIVLVTALYLFLVPVMPEHIARHIGPDGVGSSSTPVVLTIICASAAMAFAIGASAARGFMKAGHWYQTEKSIAVGILSLGYGIVGIALATLLSTAGTRADPPSGNSMGIPMLAFLFFFIAAAWVHTAALPRGQREELDGR